MKFTVQFLLILFMCLSAELVFSQDIKEPLFHDYYEVVSERKIEDDSLSGHVELSFNSVGNLYILDVTRGKVIIFDRDLYKISDFGNLGDGEGEFERASDIYIDENDLVYVTDAFLQKLNKFDADGNFIQSYALNNQATDLIKIGDKFCTHVGGAIPLDGYAMNCYNGQNFDLNKEVLPYSEVVKNVPMGITNVTFNVIQRWNNKIIALGHPIDGEIYIFSQEGILEKNFTIENEYFKQPEIDDSFNILQDSQKDFVDSIIYGIHVFDEKIWVIQVEFETGRKFLDIYNLSGDRVIDEIISMNGSWPLYNDDEGNFYSLSFGQDGENLFLKKYAPK